MKLTKVHLFVILLLALVFCSFLGGTCARLEGFNMPSDTHPYKGKGQYSDKFSSYGGLYSANDKYSRQQDAAFDSGSSGSNQGIPASQIPSGQEDLYMLKSQIVPPVCPACPATKCPASSTGNNKCPPCPPCARCPEPAFECKKVPNFRSGNDNVMPRPVIADFSQFGM